MPSTRRERGITHGTRCSRVFECAARGAKEAPSSCAQWGTTTPVLSVVWLFEASVSTATIWRRPGVVEGRSGSEMVWEPIVSVTVAVARTALCAPSRRMRADTLFETCSPT